MKSWFWSSILFLLGYAIATVVGFGLFYISPILMWIGTFTVMPGVFAYLFYWYLRRVMCVSRSSLREIVRVVAYWVTLSFLLDALVYIAIVPAIRRTPANWRFFLDQSPWIWLCYLFIFVAGLVGRWYYLRRIAEPGGAANGSQPICTDTNQTSSAAGSRR